jgi:hypothetical protein
MRESLLLPEPPLTTMPQPFSNARRPLRPKPAQPFTPTVKTVPDAVPHKFVSKPRRSSTKDTERTCSQPPHPSTPCCSYPR